MNDNFDEAGFEKRSQNYSLLSILCSLIAFASAIYIGISLPGNIGEILDGNYSEIDNLEVPSFFFMSMLKLFSFASVVLLIFSFVKREPTSTNKWVAVILCIILAFVVIGFVFYNETLTMYKLIDS